MKNQAWKQKEQPTTPNQRIPSNQFESFVSQTISFETGGDRSGAYTNDPDDKGGETKWGISKRSFPNLNIKGLSFEEAKVIYFQYYYDLLYDMILSSRIAFKLFDMSVLMGSKGTIKRLQKAIVDVSGLTLKRDGIFGPMTLTALNITVTKIGRELDLYNRFIDKIERRLRWLAYSRPRQAKFLTGWINRLKYEWQEK